MRPDHAPDPDVVRDTPPHQQAERDLIDQIPEKTTRAQEWGDRHDTARTIATGGRAVPIDGQTVPTDGQSAPTDDDDAGPHHPRRGG